MKKFFLYLSAAVLMVAGCSKNNPEPEPDYSEEELNDFLQEVFWEQTDAPEYKIVKKEIVTPDEMAESIFGTNGDLDETALECKRKFLEECDKAQKDLLKEDSNGTKRLAFEKQYLEYLTYSETGHRDLNLSCFIAYAVYGSITGDFYAHDAENVFFCCPFTHTLEKECATESDGGKEFAAMWSQNLFIMPDGQGFGADKNHTQTYLNHELHALQYYDAMKVGILAFTLHGGKTGGKFKKNWQLRIAGASQGAGDAIAFHKYLDTHVQQLDLRQYYNDGRRSQAEDLCRKYGFPIGTPLIDVPLCYVHRFSYSIVCCGPYSPEVTMRTYSRWGGMSYPCVIPLVIKSMLKCYPKELPYDEEEFFSKDWNGNKADFDKIYLEKTMPSDKLNEYICDKLNVSGPYLLLSKMLSEEMLDTDSQIYNDLIACLKKQDLTRGWTPRTGTIIYYTEADEVVPYENTLCLTALLNSTKTKYQMIDCTRIWAHIKAGHVAACAEFIISGIFIW